MKEWTAEDWQKQIKLGLKFRKLKSWQEHAPRLKQYYRHEFKAGELPYNLMFSYARVMIPSVYFRDPYIMVKARKKEIPREHSWMVEACDNYLIGKTKVKHTLSKMILDTLIHGYAGAKIGYDEDILKTPSGMEAMMQMIVKPSKKESWNYNYNVAVQNGLPWALRAKPEDIVVQYGTEEFGNIGWCANRMIRPTEELKADPRFVNTASIEGGLVELQEDTDRKDIFKEADLNFTEYWEISDYRSGKSGALLPGGADDKRLWIRPMEKDPLLDSELNWAWLTFGDDPDYAYHVPEFFVLEPQQREMTEARTQAMYHRRIALLRFLVKEGIIKDIDHFLDGDVGAFIECAGSVSEENIRILQAHIPPDIVAWVNQVREDGREVLGWPQPASGQFAQGRHTATETSFVAAGFDTRAGDKRDAVGVTIKSIIDKYNDIIFTRWSKEQAFEVLGIDGALYWVSYSPKQVKGDYDLQLDLDSLSPMTRMTRRKEIAELMQGMAKMPGANIRPLVEQLVKDYGWVDVKDLLPQAPEGMMNERQFTQQQRGLQKNPAELQKRVQGYSRNAGS